MFRSFAAGAILLASSIVFHSAVEAAKTADIGVAAAVRPQATGTPPEQDTRILHVGIDLFADERIETGKAGQTHLLFRDGSALSIGPGASLVLDEFVYSPETKTGKLAVSVTKGVFRFVGGRLSKNQPVLFRTPTAVIGVRGGVAMMDVNSPQDVANAQQQGQNLNPANVTMLYGDEVFMDNGQTRQTMTRPGSTMSQTPGGGFTPPAPATQQQLNAALSTLEEPQDDPQDDDGAGGLGAIAPAAGGPAVSDTDVSDSQLSELGSSNSPNALDGGLPPAPDPSTSTPSTDEPSQRQALDETPILDETPAVETPIIEPPIVTPPIEAVIDADTLANLVIEGADLGTLIAILARLVSDDSDATASFSLTDSAEGRFAIDPATGRVSVADGDSIDFESATAHSITIQAQSSNGNALTITVGIQVEDDTSEFTVVSVSDIDASTNQVSEVASNGASVGLTGFSNDADGTDSVTYALVDSAGGRFTIDPNTGIITVADASQIDFESNTTHDVTVRGTSTDGSFFDETFTITVLDDPGDNAPVTLIGRARCCETNGTGTNDGTAARDFTLTNVNLVGNSAVFTGPNGTFTLFYPSSDGTFGSGASVNAPFDANFGLVTSSTVVSAFNQDFVFYELNNVNSDRAILLTGPQTPQVSIPTSGYSIYQIFDDSTNTDPPSVSRVPFVRHAISGMEDNTDAYFSWGNPTGSFGIGRVLISGTGTGQNASASVVVGNILLSDTAPNSTFLTGHQRGSSRSNAGSPRHYDGNVASLPLLSKSSTEGHFIGSTQPVGFHLAAGTASDGLEPVFGGIIRRHGADNFPDRPNAVGLLESHSASPPNSKNTGTIHGWFGGVAAIYLSGSSSTAPDEFVPLIAENVLSGDPNLVVSKNTVPNDIVSVTAEGVDYDNNDSSGTFKLNYGGNSSHSVFIDDEIFMARETSFMPGDIDGQSLPTGTTRGYFTTAHNFEHNGFQGSTSFCTCSFLTWGFFGIDTVDPTSNDTVRAQLTTWVAGEVQDSIAHFPDGAASYSGHVIGTVGLPASGTSYIAVGDLDMNLNFFNGGEVTVTSGTISNFDNGNYSMSNAVGGPLFSVTADLSLTSKAGYAAGDIQGRFAGSFYGTGSPPDNVAGNFRLEKVTGGGADYDAAGIGMAEIVTP